MPNVCDAFKKHQAEEAEQGKQTDTPLFSWPLDDVQTLSPTSQDAPSGVIANSDNGYSPLIVAHHDRGGIITEEYRTLCTNLLAQCFDGRFCYLITSADTGEGKTVTCLNLGLVMAERVDHRTIVIDCNLRNSRMAHLLNAPTSPGMSDLLGGTAMVGDAIQPTAYPNLFFIPSGQAEQDQVGELLGRPELNEIVSELGRRYDYMLFDTPPINTFSDAGMLGRVMDGALLVVRMNATHREAVEKSIRLLRAANVKPAGLVLTHRKHYLDDYLYRYL